MNLKLADNPNNPGPWWTWKDRIRALQLAIGVQDEHALLRDQRMKNRKGPHDDTLQEVIDDVGHFVLGDVNIDQHRRRTNGFGKALAGMALGAAMGAGPLAYLMLRDTPPAPPPAVHGDTNTDTTHIIDIGKEPLQSP